MKSLNNSPKNSADYRRSWEYWANIHGYYGPQSPDGVVADTIQYLKTHNMAEYVKYYDGITDQTPPDAIAQAIWATCEHSGNVQSQQAQNFFGWHRMYLYYFERVLRWAANDDTLRLPYWDYTDPQHLALPAEFQDKTSPLYDDKRDPGMNTGQSQLDSQQTNVNILLAGSNYFNYEFKIERGIHGYVHCTVGPDCPVAHMGDVPLAGNDPVFYTHHANIDRLWACWQKLHPLPAGTWQDQQYSFVDETGTLKKRPVKDFIKSTTLGYEYDNESQCSRPGVALNIAVAAAPRAIQKNVVGATPQVSITQPETTVDLPISKPTLQGLLPQAQKAEDIELVLRDVTADSPPGAMFKVYLAKKNDPATRQYVGTISWFGFFRSHHGKREGARQTLTFDVTSQVKALGGAAAESGLTVVIEATKGRVPTGTAAAPQAAVQFKTEANVKIGAIELQGPGTPAKPAKKKK
jgi:Common central domain of tyrosinase/Polyphenol oxidase middle domain